MAPEVAPPRTSAGAGPVVPLFLLGLGAYIAWFAIHYWRDQTTIWPSDPVKSVLQGKGLPAPVKPAQTEQATVQAGAAGASGSSGGGGGGGGGAGQGGATGQAIAQAALKYKGHAYRFGGAPGTSGKNPWDCSSFVNWVIAHDMGLAIPPSTPPFDNGANHGPATGSWIVWSGCKTISRKSVAAGDIMVWQTHMGIAISNTQMISARDPAEGTGIDTITGDIPGELLVPRRLNVIGQAASGKGGGSSGTNQNTARLLTQPYGWSPTQNQNEWQALVELWNRESGWRVTAQNPSSGAYGIPQSLPGSKMAKFGKAWRTSARIQILWGLWYIKTTYGSPIAALAHENSAGWY
jgi:cell wall-associated NlpC family hydrolase